MIKLAVNIVLEIHFHTGIFLAMYTQVIDCVGSLVLFALYINEMRAIEIN